MKNLFVSLLLLCSISGLCNAADINYDKIGQHPRLLMKKGEETLIRASIKRSPMLMNVHETIIDYSEHIMTEPPVKRILEGRRLLEISREALKRIFYLSYSFRMTEDERYLKRAEEEMVAVCNFEDWNPSHFLDVGEMVMGLAIGYDWLYDEINPGIRELIKTNIIEKGLHQSWNKDYAWFYNSTYNWNSVCNAGMTYGALALYEDIPDLAKEIIDKSLESNLLALGNYAPDGGYPEGYAYWGYGVSFEVMLIAGLESVFGTDNGLSEAPGFMKTGEFIEFMVSPTNMAYNFADSPPAKGAFDMMSVWFAIKNNDLSLLWLARQHLKKKPVKYAEDRLLPAMMVFCKDTDLSQIRKPDKNIWINRGETPLFIYRGGWEDDADTYFAIKGGCPKTGHAHMDNGSFVYQSHGIQWSIDLGKENYFQIESADVDLWSTDQDSERWELFRLGSSSHSTLTVNGENHCAAGVADFIGIVETDNSHGVIIDLGPSLGNRINHATRTAYVSTPEENIHIKDHVGNGDKPVTIRWTMCTSASPTILDDNRILLEKDGHKLIVSVSSSCKLDFRIWDNNPSEEYEQKNPGTCRVGYEARLGPEEELYAETILYHYQ